MSIKFQEIKPMGERAILVEFEPEIHEDTLEKVLVSREILISRLVEVKVEIISAFNSLLIIYPLAIENLYDEVLRVQTLIKGANIGKKNQKNLYQIPVCYDLEFGWDLKQISAVKQLPVEKIILLHSQPIYTVYFTGFLPGFLYLGGLPEKLHFPRKDQPRLEVPKGAVGIGGNQTGIYPKKSPGGWQIIGNSPVSFFDKNADPPCEISAGDRVKFYPVSQEEYFSIEEEVVSGKFQIKREKFYD